MSVSLVLLRSQSDERLVALAREGHERAFEAIVKRYGPSPQRTFKQAGVLDGQLKVTDESGLKATRSFSVNVTK